MKNRLLLLSTGLIALVATPALAQDVAADTAQYRANAEFLADDLLEGRESGTRGYDIAANYVATQFMALGIAPGDLDGDYMQPIAFAKAALDENGDNYITIDGVRHDHGDQYLVSQDPAGGLDEEAELVFVGPGLYVPEFGIDTFGDIDMTGKIAVTMFNRGGIPGVPSDVGAHLGNAQSAMIEAKGAVGVITVLPQAMLERFPWERVKRYSAGARSNWINAAGVPNNDNPGLRVRATLGPQARDALFEGTGMTWQDIESKLLSGQPVAAFPLDKRARIVAANSIVPDYQTANVVGMIEGSDPELKDELVIMTAHLDHVGIKEDAKPGEDRIYNGLFDNALGVAAVLDVARRFAESGEAPRRSIAFVALAAEEKGLKGSDWLAHNLDQFPGKRVVGTVNLDMPVIPADFDRIVAYGAEHSTIGPVVAEAAEKMGVTRIDDPVPEEVYFVRSDHYSFVKAGIPSVYLDTIPVAEAKPLYDDFIENRYHKVTDQIGQPIDWNAAARFAEINYLITRRMADDDQRPMWYVDSYFGNAMAPNAEKATR